MGARFLGAYAALFLPFAIVLPYLQVLLRDLGYDARTIGTVQGTLEVLTVLSPPLWGLLADRLGRPRLLLTVGVVVSAAVFGLFSRADTAAGAVAVAVAFGLFYRPLIPLTAALTFQYIRVHGGDYGTVRVAGSLAFSAVTLAMALLGGAGSAEAIFAAFLIASCLHLGGVALLPADRRCARHLAARAPGLDLRVFLSRRFVFFTLAALLGRLAMASYYHFFSLFVREALHFPSPGYLWMIGPLCEVPVILFSRRIIARVGVRGLFAAGMIGVVVRLGCYAFVTSPWQVLPLQFLHALTFGAYHVASVTYVARLVPTHMQASAQTIFSSLTVGLGGLAGGVLGGVLVQAWGFSAMYGLYSAVAAAGLGVLLVAVPREGPAESLPGR
jgi:PPP family 3-phenylpropionic acid transporter